MRRGDASSRAASARSTAVALRSWLVVLVAMLLAVAGAGSSALLLGGAHSAEAARLSALAGASTDLVLAASDAGATGGPAAQALRVDQAAAEALALAADPAERSAVERETREARSWLARVERDPAPGVPGTGGAAGAGAPGPGPVALLTAHQDLVVDVAAEATALRDREEGVRDASLAVVGLVLAGALALTLLLAARVRRGLVEPLAGVAEVLGGLTAGDHVQRARTDRGPDEVRAVARWVNAFADQSDRSRSAQERSGRLRRLATEVGRLARDPVAPEESLAEALRRLGEGMGVDRAWVRLADPATGPLGGPVSLQGAWSRTGTAPVGEDLGRHAADLSRWLQEAWDAQGQFVADDLPAHTAGPDASAASRDLLARSGASAVVVVPVGAGEVAVGALVVACDGGPRAWTDDEVALLRSVAADLGRATVVARLLHDSEQLVERLRELDVRKTTFLATVSHELRTPLTSIAGYVELLREGGAGEVSDGVDRMLAVVERNTVRLRLLIEDLLALSQIEDGAPRGVHEPVALGDLVRDVVAQHRGAAGDGGLVLDLEVDLDAELVGALQVRGDAASLRRALAGLVSNAVKFTPAGGRVAVGVRSEGGSAVVEVVDTGIGIPAAEQAGLFTRFFRASNATALEVPGTGLGLTIARSVVEHHDGQVLITSVLGEGTAVRVVLPLASSAGTPVEALTTTS